MNMKCTMRLARALGIAFLGTAMGADSFAAMDGSAMHATPITEHLFILDGAVNTGALVHGDEALLFDCCDSVTPERLKALGITSVAMILCTQHRRPNVAGAYAWEASGAEIVAPASEKALFDDVAAYWNDWRNRWHLYHSQPGPQVLATSLHVARTATGGDVITWNGYSIRVFDTPGATDGSVSYNIEVDGKNVCFCGDLLFGQGQIWDLYSLQKGFGCVGDYHGFLGNREKLVAGLHTVVATGADLLIPSHGPLVTDPKVSAKTLEERLDALWRNYAAVSALNFYFPSLFEDMKDDPRRMRPAKTMDPPEWVRRIDPTSFAIVSETGAVFLVDCGDGSVIRTLREWQHDKRIGNVEGCWITHYHDDHVDALPEFANAFRRPVYADEHLAEILSYPLRFFLPCISPNAALDVKATHENESWPWHEFQYTAFHFPGQTLHHGGLLVEGHGAKVLFAGDSFAPTGFDDYTCANRVFLGADKGMRRCLDIIRAVRPDYILNEHQPKAFVFTDEQIAQMDSMLAERERIVAAMTPWDNPNFALDEGWVRTYPYEQEAAPGATFAIDLQATNHAPGSMELRIEPVLPDAWRTMGVAEKVTVAAGANGAVRAWIQSPPTAKPGRYVIPFRVTFGGRYLGQFRHAIVVLR